MLKIKQEQVYQGDDWWDWSVWITGTPTEMENVQEVVWQLHPSFNPSSVRKSDRSNAFRLNTSGWGTFMVKADLKLRNGTTQELKHELVLLYPETKDRIR
jgi:transcription initiation factor IIF auxiliary subunit